MNGYFIHTIEFCKRISYEEYWQLRNTMKFISYHKESTLHEVRCLDYNDSGLIMILRKCTEKERLNDDFNNNYQLMLIVNPSRMIAANTYMNVINDINEFINAINNLEKMIYCIFEKNLPGIRSLEDFKFNRIDITKDIHNIPETIVCEYILLMRRMQLYSGYEIDRQIEKNCSHFRIKDSVNLINESRGIKF